MKNQNNSNKVKEKSLNQPADSRIAAVRDLIFGENMQQYDQDFNEVTDQIAELKKANDKNSSELATNLQVKLDAIKEATDISIAKLSEDIHKKLERLDEAKADRKKLGKALEKIALMLQG